MAHTYPLATERNLILGVLLALAAAAWVILFWQWATMGEGHEMEMTAGLTMGMSAGVFLGAWVAMMVAIMFPTSAPMILTFARVQATRKDRGQPFVPVWLFTGSYIALWSATGIVACAAALSGNELA